MAVSSTSPKSTTGGSSGLPKPTGNIGEWWADLTTTNEIATIRAAQEAEFLRIEEAAKLNQQIFGLASEMFETVRSQIGDSAVGQVPSEFDDMIALFEAGGEFGEGQNLAIERGGQEALAGGQIALAQTGLSSGTNAAGLSARVEADKALAKAGVEGQRVQELAGALGQKGEAGLVASGQAQTAQNSLLQVLASMQPNFVAA